MHECRKHPLIDTKRNDWNNKIMNIRRHNIIYNKRTLKRKKKIVENFTTEKQPFLQCNLHKCNGYMTMIEICYMHFK